VNLLIALLVVILHAITGRSDTGAATMLDVCIDVMTSIEASTNESPSSPHAATSLQTNDARKRENSISPHRIADSAAGEDSQAAMKRRRLIKNERGGLGIFSRTESAASNARFNLDVTL